jgi:hypothetical protein
VFGGSGTSIPLPLCLLRHDHLQEEGDAIRRAMTYNIASPQAYA